jgi:hypothetical protein
MNHRTYTRAAFVFCALFFGAETLSMNILLKRDHEKHRSIRTHVAQHPLTPDRAEKIEEIRNTPQEEIVVRNINLKPCDPINFGGTNDIFLQFRVIPNNIVCHATIAKGPNIPSRLIEKVKSLGVGEELAHLKEDYILIYAGKNLLDYSDSALTQTIENYGQEGGAITLVRKNK